jgi:hypothetical protein
MAQRRVWPYRAALLLVPVVVLWHQDNSLFPPPGQIDTWVYLGYFRNLVNFKRDLFAGTYYGSRLTWILPGWVAHSLLPPVAASAALHLGVLLTAVLSLFETLRLTVGRRAAFLTSLIFGFHPQVWYSAGWDYFDGIGIAYFLLTLALVTRAAVEPRRTAALVLAGGAIAGLLYSNLFWVMFVPVLLLLYAALSWKWRGSGVKDIAADVARCAAGFLAVTAVLCAINYALDGNPWFYSPSLHVAPQLVGWKSRPVIPESGYGLVPWLWFPAAACATAVIRWVAQIGKPLRDDDAPLLLYSGLLLLPMAAYCYLEAYRFGVFLAPFYPALLLPQVFLVIGAGFWQHVELASRPVYLATCGAAVLLFGIVWFDSARVLPMWPEAIAPVAITSLAMLAAAQLLRRRAAAAFLAIAGFALLSMEVRYIPARQLTLTPGAPRPDGPHAYRQMLERVLENRRWIESVRHGRPVRFSYDRADPMSEDVVALNATYLYGYTLWTTPFPRLACPDPPPPGTVVVVASKLPDTAETARRTINACAASGGLLALPLASRASPHPSGVYTTAVLTMSRDPARWRWVQPVSDDSGKGSLESIAWDEAAHLFPVDRWRALEPGLGMDLRRTPDGLALKTPKQRYAKAAGYGPLVVRDSGRYTFTLRYRSKSPLFGFGVRAADGATWLATDVLGAPERKVDIDLAAGQQVQIEIVNNHPVDEPAELTILSLQATMLSRTNAAVRARTPGALGTLQ